MNKMALEEQISSLRKELSLSGTEIDNKLLELRADVDRIKLELAALRAFLGAVNPSFEEQFPQILARTIQEVDPEWC